MLRVNHTLFMKVLSPHINLEKSQCENLIHKTASANKNKHTISVALHLSLVELYRAHNNEIGIRIKSIINKSDINKSINKTYLKMISISLYYYHSSFEADYL